MDDTSAAYYRTQAERVLERAHATRSNEARRKLMDSVELYRHLALRAEQDPPDSSR
jgi:hypothetical protein